MYTLPQGLVHTESTVRMDVARGRAVLREQQQRQLQSKTTYPSPEPKRSLERGGACGVHHGAGGKVFKVSFIVPARVPMCKHPRTLTFENFYLLAGAHCSRHG